MCLQFYHVFAGKGMRCRAVETDTMIDGGLITIEKLPESNLPDRQLAGCYGLAYLSGYRAGNPYYTDAANPGGCCNGSNGLHGELPVYFPPASMRLVIIHCWAIDRILFTTQ